MALGYCFCGVGGVTVICWTCFGADIWTRLTLKIFWLGYDDFSADYSNVPKLPKIQTKRPNHRIFCPKVANGIANSEDP